jgi:hypothetical protein
MTKPAQTPGPSPLARTWAERTRRPEQARLAAFWLEAAVLVLFLAASAAGGAAADASAGRDAT